MAYTVCPVRFATESKPTLRRVRSDASAFEPGGIVFVEVGADWEAVTRVHLDWQWLECVVEKVDGVEGHVGLSVRQRNSE